VSFVCCQVEVSASGRSPVQRSPTDCGVSECDREASIMRRPWPTRAVKSKKKLFDISHQSLRLVLRQAAFTGVSICRESGFARFASV
jgi:hypothetical protein